MKTKEDIVLDLIRDNKITNEEAKMLLAKDYQYIHTYYPYYNSWNYPINPIVNPIITYSNGTFNNYNSANTLTMN